MYPSTFDSSNLHKWIGYSNELKLFVDGMCVISSCLYAMLCWNELAQPPIENTSLKKNKKKKKRMEITEKNEMIVWLFNIRQF